MQYNYDFEIAAFLLMAVILLHFLFIRQFPTDKAKIFRALLITCFAECGGNILSSVGLEYADSVPQIVNEILAFAFFLLEGLCSYLIFRYVMVLCEFEPKHNRIIMAIGTIPFAIFEILALLTPFIGVFYYIEDNQYHQGFGANFGYYYLVFFYILDMILVLVRRKRIDLRMKVIIILYTVVAIGAILIQFMVRGLLLTSISNLFIILMLYLSMQNPSELLDPITGIGNESALLLQLKDKMSHNKRMLVVTLDICQFHQINALFGMENSDALLSEIGKFLYYTGEKFHVFHNSGDIFTLILEDDESGRTTIEKIRKRFHDEWMINGNHIVVDVVIAVKHFPRDFTTVEEYVGIRDYLLDRAKHNAKQQIFETDLELIEEYRRRSEVSLALRRAIENRSLQVYYQPIYSLREKRIISLEALARLNDEKLGFVPPDEFITLAEKNGSIIQIGEIVLEECCKFLSKHVLSNTSLGIRTIQINVSVAQCMQQNLKESIVPILEKYHIPPSMITLEITESTAINAPGLMQRHMRELGELGIAFAADDYGSGNSNYSYLIKFPFKEIKIDKEMTWEYFKSETARIILENEIRTMDKLGIPIVVEGIETKEQSDAMEQLGVTYIQGYYYGRPLPETECLRYIRNFNSDSEEYGR